MKGISKEIIIVALSLILISGVGIMNAQNPKTVKAVLVNTQEWEAGEISHITMNYTSDKVYVMPVDGDQVILKEYCSSNNSDYYARTSVEHDTLSIQKGSRPNKAYSFYAEIYVPDNCMETLDITTTSGAIIVQSANGLKVANMNLTTDSGRIDSATGFIGNLDVYSESGKIAVALPENDSYVLSAKTNSGTVHNYFGEPFRFEIEKKHLVGNYGENPVHSINLETKSSTIDVFRMEKGNADYKRNDR